MGRSKYDCWLLTRRRPGCRQKRRMVGSLAKAAVQLVMQNPFYSFTNITKKQMKGGAIGNSLTERLGRLIMKRFSRKFKALLEKSRQSLSRTMWMM